MSSLTFSGHVLSIGSVNPLTKPMRCNVTAMFSGGPNVAQIHAQRPLARAPALVRLPGPVIRRLLALGVRIGPNWLLTVRGRKTGEPHSYPLAVMEIDGSRYVIGTFGDVGWCRNLRANPDGEIQLGSRREDVHASELTPDQAAAFFRDRLAPAIPRMRFLTRLATNVFVRGAAPDILSDPSAASLRRPVFKLDPRGE
jgi:deazaflavin-dependent oxidoreductase (nitroreductase family)